MSNKDMLDFKNVILSSPNKIRALNPNAAEFVPSSFQFPPKNTTNAGSNVPGTSGKATLELPVSTGTKSSEDEAHQYWLQQLPDDITPDFGSEDGSKMPGNLSLSGLSLQEDSKFSQFPVSRDYSLSGDLQAISPQVGNGSLNEFSRYRDLDYSGENISLDAMNATTKLWDGQYSADVSSTDGIYYDGAVNAGFVNDMADENNDLDNAPVDPVDFLSSNFPGFATECLADIYYANGCDLSLTIEILTQLELQVDGGFNQSLPPKTPSTPNFSSLDFPSLPISEAESTIPNYSGSDAVRHSDRHQSVDKGALSFLNFSSYPRGTQDFASAVRKYVPQDASYWKPEVNGSTDKVVGSSRGSMLQSAAYSPQGKLVFGDKIQNGSREAPVWLETGDAVGNLYLQSREEARDLARVRNACFDQASQAYLIGNKALAKELSLKGKWYGMKMEAAHEKAKELIFKQRNPVAHNVHSYYRGKELMIDLHGLHVSEAIYVLRHELGVLRKSARSAGQRLQVLICVGTGHHTKGSRTPARLPVAVEKYLLDEQLQYSEPQSGLFRVVVA